jgi:hypothetical protein
VSEHFARGRLLCTLSHTGRSWLDEFTPAFRSVAIYEHALLLLRSSAKTELSLSGIGSKTSETWLEDKRQLRKQEAALPVDQVLAAHRENRLLHSSDVAEARVRRGFVASMFVLRLNDGTKIKRMWMAGDGWRRTNTPNGPYEEAEAALRRWLGPKLRSD